MKQQQTRERIFDARYSMLDARCWMLDAGIVIAMTEGKGLAMTTRRETRLLTTDDCLLIAVR